MKPFTTIAIVIFALMALAHLVRLIRGLEVVIQGTPVPQWASALGLAVAAIMALMIWREARRAYKRGLPSLACM